MKNFLFVAGVATLNFSIKIGGRAMKRSILAAITLCLINVVNPASGAPIVDGFDGQTIQIQYLFPNIGTVFNSNSGNVVVGPGFEKSGYPVGDPRTNIDISDKQINITYNSAATWTSTAFNGEHFFDINDTITDIIGVSINGATNLAGFNASRITFDADNIYINWQGLSFNQNTIVRLDVTFEAVPEPASLTIFGIMAVGGAVYGWRRRKLAVVA